MHARVSPTACMYQNRKEQEAKMNGQRLFEFQRVKERKLQVTVDSVGYLSAVCEPQHRDVILQQQSLVLYLLLQVV